ncbi:MAG: type I secretion system permease/ATPase [Defluviimonas sp.]|uniref:type I secretion system permease/ATPase n=1 Tax=Albidovulum sp. TaxID=1872424 RepID=UPI001D6CC5F8|nr:type I secretion system permease/ATPase [Paracoccaceae bacterium]MCC0063230.1 type I secretion system permease/ATPase [Defluviimonas sp.]
MAKPTAEAAQVVPAAGQVTSARPGPEATGPEATGPQRRAFGPTPAGQAELDAARASDRALVWTAAVFSAFMNLLMLTGPLFMLQVYDRVLGSRSEETLLSLFVLVSFLFTMMGLLDLARTRVMARIAARYQGALETRVFAAMIAANARPAGRVAEQGGPRDLEILRQYLASPVRMALFDMPWVPLFLAAVFVFHPLMGVLALAGGVVLVATTLLNQRSTRQAVLGAAGTTRAADLLAEQFREEADLVQSLGMAGASHARWQRLRDQATRLSLLAGDRAGAFTVFSKTFRLFLQSAMLALGAWLVLKGAITPGAMIASSVMMGRALAPVELAVGGWALIQQAGESRRRLAALLASTPAAPVRTALPRPAAHLAAQNLTVVPPGQQQAALRMVNFTLEPGKALGVIGPSGAGKTTLARAITGQWPPAGGSIRLDGATLDQYDDQNLGRHIGYLPQRVTLFDGTIAENIARLAAAPDDGAVVAAAQSAAAHRMIVELPDGYDTRVSRTGGRLSGGQLQRIGLARALYGDPVILVLDEPNSNLDNDGSLALNGAIRALKERGGAVVIMAHRPSAIQECDLLMMLDGGIARAFGPRDEVLRTVVRNAGEIARAGGSGGVL